MVQLMRDYIAANKMVNFRAVGCLIIDIAVLINLGRKSFGKVSAIFTGLISAIKVDLLNGRLL